VPALRSRAAYAKQAMRDRLIEHKEYIGQHGDDRPEIKNWRWGGRAGAARGADTAADNV
jgi:xylulose-5-phosphate/fructose-6-phosphate phosphoketolase